MSRLKDLRKMYDRLGDREMPDGLRDRIYNMIDQHSGEGSAVVTHQEHKMPRLFKRLVAPVVSGVSVVVALGVVAGVLTRSQKIVPVLGGYQRSVQWSQVPQHVRLSIDAIESFDDSMKPNMIRQLTESRPNILSKPVYHVELKGKFPIQESLPHKTGQQFPQIKRLMLSIPSDNSYVSLQGYNNNKLVYAKRHLPVVNKHWTFSGNSSMWQATYTIDLSAVEFPQYDYAQMTSSHYKLRYLGKDSSAIGHISYKFTFPGGERFSSNRINFPSSGVISDSAGQGGGLGALTDYSGEHGTFTVNWENKNATIHLTMSKPNSRAN